jgi:hypothetical protein
VSSVVVKPVGFPAWIKPGLNITNGRDQLSLATITINQIMPILVPGVVALSRRARYLSLYLFLLEEYHRRGSGTQDQLSTFIKRAEYEYLLAVRHCSRDGCGADATAIIGYFEVQDALDKGPPYRRGESIEGVLGGYAQQYRSLLQAMELVAPKGYVVNGKPLSVDRATTRGAVIAAAFRAQLASSAWYKRYLGHGQAIPAKVLEELSDRACLCRLDESPTERGLLHTSLFGTRDQQSEDQKARIAAFALTLEAIEADPKVIDDDSCWRRHLWDAGMAAVTRKGVRSQTAAGWAALVGKELYQEALAVIWSAVCEWGRAKQPPDGFTPRDLRAELVKGLCSGGRVFGVKYSPKEPVRHFAERLDRELIDVHLEHIRERAWLPPHDAMNGFGLLLVLWQRLPDLKSMPVDWQVIGRQRSLFQLGLLGATDSVGSLADSGTSVADVFESVTMRWVVQAHDRVGCDRLPNYIFRFRFVEGRWQFIRTSNTDPLSLGDSRHDAITYISQDLGFWNRDGERAKITGQGKALIRGAFGT